MHKSDPSIINQLEEALEERYGSDRRKLHIGNNPITGEDRRKEDRRKAAEKQEDNKN